MKDGDERIFVSIAAYRDPQLLSTINECLSRCRFPDRLRFGIFWQRGSDELSSPWFADPRFRVLEIDWLQSKGTCWARAEIMKLWDGEGWYLQLDSHHRFADDWDVKILQQARLTGSRRPLLTAYAPPYRAGDAQLRNVPTLMDFDFFTEEGIVRFRLHEIAGDRAANGPLRGRFVSGHFLFAPGHFVKAVPYDPDLYHLGEEIMLTIRAYTHGFDIFHPSEVIVWHEYLPKNRRRHWDDHPEAELERDVPSREKIRKFLSNPHIGQFGCGTQRTFSDYEAYAGLNFRYRCVQDYTRSRLEPPNPALSTDWIDRVRDRRVRISVDGNALPSAAWSNSCWYVGIFDSEGHEICRFDAQPGEIKSLHTNHARNFILRREFQSGAEPKTWIIWPYNKSVGWLERLTGEVTGELDHGAAAQAPSGFSSAAKESDPRAMQDAELQKDDDAFFVALPDGPLAGKYLIFHNM